jgi:hypothetical protein
VAALAAKMASSGFTQAATAGLWTGSGCGTGTNSLLVNGTCGASGGGGGGGGSATMASQLLDFAVTVSAPAVETMCAACSTSTPGILGTGPARYVLTAPLTVTINGASTNGTVYWYLSSGQILTAGHSSAATLTGSSGIQVATGITAFPPDALPLWVTTFTANVWDSINESAMDYRAFLMSHVTAVGNGILSTSNPSTGIQTLSTDPTQVPRFFSGSGAPTGTCQAARDFYTNTSGPHLYWCGATNAWTLVI